MNIDANPQQNTSKLNRTIHQKDHKPLPSEIFLGMQGWYNIHK